VHKKGYSKQLKVAYITGDDLLAEVKAQLESGKLPAHLDEKNPNVKLHELTAALKDVRGKPLVSANEYLGARGIMAALGHSADIIICGWVADASPVIAAAWYWHGWLDTDYNNLAGALVAGMSPNIILRRAGMAKAVIRPFDRVFGIHYWWELLWLRRVRPGHARRFAFRYCRDRSRWSSHHHQARKHE
jgi:Acyclic terpene utilisation family protein AtuA